VPTAGTYAIKEAAPQGSSFTPTYPDARVQLNVGGTVYTATLPRAESADTWLRGAMVRETRYTVTPVDLSGTPHPFLSVIFDVRAYLDGATRLDVTVEDTADIPAATSATYSVDVIANGQNVYHHDTLTQYYLTRWRKTFDLGLTESQVTPDFGPYYQSGALPQYLDSVPNDTYSVTGPTFDILQRGGLTFNQMDQAGGRPELAPYPDWVAEYLVHKDPTQRAYILRTGDLSGSQPLHLREFNGSPVSIDARPNFWIDWRGGPGNSPAGDMTAIMAPLDQNPIYPNIEHQVSMAYVPYLLTGDRYYAEELAFWADYGMLASQPLYIRQESLGLLGDGSVRAIAWPLRELADAAAYLPDNDPNKAYFAAKVENNLQWFDQYASGQNPYNYWPRPPSNALGTSFELTSPDMPGYQGKVIMSQWQQNFLAWAISHANAQGFTGGDVLMARMVAFQNKLFNSGPNYPREYAAPYYPQVGTYDTAGNWTFFTSMQQVFDANDRNPDGSIIPVDQPEEFQGYYGRDARLSLMTATRLGMLGAQDAYDYLMQELGTNIQPGYAIAPMP